MKDIFIDTNVAIRFANPLDENFKELVRWLFNYDELNLTNNAYLVVSNKLIQEYCQSNRNCSKPTSIPILVDKMTRENRLFKIENQALDQFMTQNFKPKIIKRFLSNVKDHFHIALILMSPRKYALARDDNFIHDLESYAGYLVTVRKRPEDLDYRN